LNIARVDFVVIWFCSESH